eukprot:1161273-Amphidinium_carterae.2
MTSVQLAMQPPLPQVSRFERVLAVHSRDSTCKCETAQRLASSRPPRVEHQVESMAGHATQWCTSPWKPAKPEIQHPSEGPSQHHDDPAVWEPGAHTHCTDHGQPGTPDT